MKIFSELEKQKVFKDISDIADQLGIECYVIGGYVRDLILGYPSHDIDIVVVGSGIQIAEAFHKRVGGKLSIYQSYGTAMVNYSGIEVEFVGARKESYERGSRNPIVENGTLEDDQLRRDFTINAMAICLNKSRFGELVDPFNGIEDLKNGIIRTPTDPTITFSDDPLRMLRCIRFATRFGFDIDQITWQGVCQNSQRLEIIVQERITDELNKIILSSDPKRGFVLLKEAGLLQQIIPELTVLDTNDKVGEDYVDFHKNNFWHSVNVLDNMAKRSDGLWIRWAALLHDIGKEPTKRHDPVKGWTFYDHEHMSARMIPKLFTRMKQPLGEEMKYVQTLVELHMRPQIIANDQVTDSAVRRLCSDAGDYIDDLMTLCECDLTTRNLEKKQHFLNNFRKVREMIEDLKQRDFKRLFQPCIDGNQIMELLNLRPSREVGILKQVLKDAVLDNIVPNEPEPLKELLYQKAREIGVL